MNTAEGFCSLCQGLLKEGFVSLDDFLDFLLIVRCFRAFAFSRTSNKLIYYRMGLLNGMSVLVDLAANCDLPRLRLSNS